VFDPELITFRMRGQMREEKEKEIGSGEPFRSHRGERLTQSGRCYLGKNWVLQKGRLFGLLLKRE